LVLVLAAGFTAGCTPDIERLEQKRDVQGLIKALEHEEQEVRRRAAQALGAIGDPRAVEPLDFMLRGGRDSLEAAKALGQIGDSRAVKSLMWAVRADMEEEAAAGLVELGEPGVELLIDALKEWPWHPDRRAAARTLGQMGEPAVEPLMALLGASSTDATLATEALVLIGEPAFEPLLAALKAPSTDARAAIALGKMGDPRAVDPLIAALQDQDFPSQYAAEALGQIGDLSAVEPLIAAMMDTRSGMWESAVSALVQICLDDPSILVPFLQDASTLRVYHPLIRIGDPNTLSALTTAFREYGGEGMAEVFLNSGNDILEAEAQRWAKEHGYWVNSSPGGGVGNTWGSK